jgi:hypothetical protein
MRRRSPYFKRNNLPAGWKGVSSEAEMLQLVLDCYHGMCIMGHYPAEAFLSRLSRLPSTLHFPIEAFYRMYHQLRDTGALDRLDVAYMRQNLEAWSIRQWEYRKYPFLRGTAPVPPRPQPTAGGCLLLPDDDDDEC